MQPKIYTNEDHHIHNDHIDPNALYVLQKLQQAGYIAYLVGGGVRDLLMHGTPKDFDISTSAEPEQVKQLFRNCILIGRRFRLAHLRFGQQIIEVSTFRRGDTTESDLILRDNEWGSPEEDVLRRDFTINGLFYDPSNHTVIDYVGGCEDLKQHLLKTIGNPYVRFKQDPVRMIRLLKFKARFSFHIDPEALDALLDCGDEITKSSSARILEEIFRMLESGAAEPFFRLLVEYGFLSILLPALNTYFLKDTAALLYSYLKSADTLNKQGRYALDRSVLATALVFPILENKIEEDLLPQKVLPHIGQIIDIAYHLIHALVFEAFSHFPRRIRTNMLFILHMQYRLIPLDKRKNLRTKIVRHREFPYALAFLKLRALIDPHLLKSYSQWRQIYQSFKQNEQQSALEQETIQEITEDLNSEESLNDS